MNQLTEQQALKRLAASCSRAEYCSSDIKKRLQRWGIAPDESDRILHRLISGKYVDDERFARHFIRDKIENNKWGRKKVVHALYMKGISREIYEPLFDEIDVFSYKETLQKLLENKLRTVKGSSNYERRTKLIRFALGRGYEPDVVLRCLDSILTDDDD